MSAVHGGALVVKAGAGRANDLPNVLMEAAAVGGAYGLIDAASKIVLSR